MTGQRRPTATEAQWQSTVIDYARLRGWRIHHQRPARTADDRWRSAITGHAGWPDLAMARTGRLVVAELKSERGKPTADQDTWLRLLRSAPGVEVYLWQPSDWPEVEAVLK